MKGEGGRGIKEGKEEGRGRREREIRRKIRGKQKKLAENEVLGHKQ